MKARFAHLCVAACLVVSFAGGSAAQASPPTTLEIRGTSTATSTVGTSIVAGDVFTWSVTFDLDSLSTSSTPAYGNTFNNAVQAFTLQAAMGNAGSWDPTGVVWPITPALNVFTNANGDAITVQLLPQNAPSLGAVPFRDLSLTIDWDASDLNAVWQQGSTTLANWLGTTTPPINAASYGFEVRDTSFSTVAFTAAVALPPPAVAAPPITPPQVLTTMPVPTMAPATSTTTSVPETATSTVPETATSTVPLDPAAIAAAPSVDLGAPQQVDAGDQVTLTATGFTPGATVEVYLASTPVLVATTTADDSGVVTVAATIPVDYVGAHSLVLYEPATGRVERQIVDITGPVLPATGPSSNTTTVLAALMTLLVGVVLLTRSWRQRPEWPNPPPR